MTERQMQEQPRIGWMGHDGRYHTRMPRESFGQSNGLPVASAGELRVELDNLRARFARLVGAPEPSPIAEVTYEGISNNGKEIRETADQRIEPGVVYVTPSGIKWTVEDVPASIPVSEQVPSQSPKRRRIREVFRNAVERGLGALLVSDDVEATVKPQIPPEKNATLVIAAFEKGLREEMQRRFPIEPLYAREPWWRRRKKAPVEAEIEEPIDSTGITRVVNLEGKALWLKTHKEYTELLHEEPNTDALVVATILNQIATDTDTTLKPGEAHLLTSGALEVIATKKYGRELGEQIQALRTSRGASLLQIACDNADLGRGILSALDRVVHGEVETMILERNPQQ